MVLRYSKIYEGSAQISEVWDLLFYVLLLHSLCNLTSQSLGSLLCKCGHRVATWGLTEWFAAGVFSSPKHGGATCHLGVCGADLPSKVREGARSIGHCESKRVAGYSSVFPWKFQKSSEKGRGWRKGKAKPPLIYRGVFKMLHLRWLGGGWRLRTFQL